MNERISEFRCECIEHRMDRCRKRQKKGVFAMCGDDSRLKVEVIFTLYSFFSCFTLIVARQSHQRLILVFLIRLHLKRVHFQIIKTTSTHLPHFDYTLLNQRQGCLIGDVIVCIIVKFKMQISEIASPTDSASSNLFRLNGSSATISTPCYDIERPLVDFEEFSQSQLHLPARPLPKKKLTIDIDEINDFEQQQAAPQKAELTRREEEGRHSLSAVQFLKMRQQLEGQRARIDALERERQYLMKENEQLKTITCKKDQMLQARQRALEQLSQKLSHIEAEVAQDRFYDQKLREKENRYKQLKKQNEKLATMNRNLQTQLRESQRKIMDLEKDIQNTMCTQYQTVLKAKQSSIKLKESSLKVLQHYAARDNKENALGNTVKSLDKKKPSTQPKKPTKIATSTLNFAKKLQMKTNLL